MPGYLLGVVGGDRCRGELTWALTRCRATVKPPVLAHLGIPAEADMEACSRKVATCCKSACITLNTFIWANYEFIKFHDVTLLSASAHWSSLLEHVCTGHFSATSATTTRTHYLNTAVSCRLQTQTHYAATFLSQQRHHRTKCRLHNTQARAVSNTQLCSSLIAALLCTAA